MADWLELGALLVVGTLALYGLLDLWDRLRGRR